MYSSVQGLLILVLNKSCSTVVYKGQHHSDDGQGPSCSFCCTLADMYSSVHGLLILVLNKSCSTVVYKGQHHSDDGKCRYILM